MQHLKFLFDVLSGTDKIAALNTCLEFLRGCSHKCVKVVQAFHSYRAYFEKSAALISATPYTVVLFNVIFQYFQIPEFHDRDSSLENE